MTAYSSPIRGRQSRTRILRPYKPQLQQLEDRCVPAFLAVTPNIIAAGLVGQSFSQSFQAIGPDPKSTGPYTYSADKTDVDGLTFAASNNAFTLSGTPTKEGSFDFKVTANENSVTGYTNYTLVVGPATTNTISIITGSPNNALPDAVAGAPYGLTLYTAGGSGGYTYTLPSPVDGLTFFPYQNMITLSGTPTSAGPFTFDITASDSAGHSQKQTFNLNVTLGLAPGQLPFPANTIAPAVVGQAYSQGITLLGTDGVVTFTNPATVDGLTLTQQGGNAVLLLSGTPTSIGSFPFTVSAHDSAGLATTCNYTLEVVSAPVTLQAVTATGTSTSPTSLAPAVVDQVYSQTFQPAGGSGTYTVFNFPQGTANGLTVTEANGIITLGGKPTAAGTFGFLITVEDSLGLSTSSQQWILNVSDAPTTSTDLRIYPSTELNLPAGTQNVPYSQTFLALGGDGTYNFSTEPLTTMPAGLAFTASGGNYVLSGVPTEAGTFPISIKVTSGGHFWTQNYILTINPSGALALTRQSLPPAMQGLGYIQNLISNAASAVPGAGLSTSFFPYQLTAAGGSGSGYVFTAKGLPPGMSVFSSGQVGGTPAEVGDFLVDVTVTDSAGNSAQQTYTMAVTPSIPFTGNPYFSDFFGGVIYQPALVKQAFGFNQVILGGGIIGTGKGQTIALIENSDQPSFVSSIPALTLDRPDQATSYATSDLAIYSSTYGLPQFGSVPGGDAPVFVKLTAKGDTNYPVQGGSNGEFAEDVTTIHTLAPEANIIVFIAPPNATDLDFAQMYPNMMSFPYNWSGLPAATLQALQGLPQVSVVSSSVYYQTNEDLGELNQEQFYTPPFPDTQPVTMIVAAGDTGYFPPALTGPQYPGNSGMVISAAMTQPAIDFGGRYLDELAVSSAGGGPSLYLPQPSWQNGVVDAYSTTTRVAPDVGMIGSFNAGMTFLMNGNWEQANGSSNAAPSWAAIMAIINQGRQLLGVAPLNGITQTIPQLYGLPASDFHKISQYENGTNLPANYNDAAGLGSPVVNSLVPGMLGGHDLIQGTVKDATGQPFDTAYIVYLDANNDGIFQPGVEGSTTVALNGSYSLLVAPGSNYLVRVQPAPGPHYVQLSANPAAIAFTPGSDETASGINFQVTSDPDTVYVAALYQQVLGHAPDTVGRDLWAQQLHAGLSPLVVASAVWESAEHRGLQVNNLYMTYLHQAPDAVGRALWINALVGGAANETTLAVALLSSGAYAATHASTEAFLTGLYMDVLGRAPDQPGLQAWEDAIANMHLSRAEVALSFVTSSPAYSLLIANTYQTYLGAAPDAGGAMAWLNALLRGSATQDQLAEAILASPAFFNLAQGPHSE